MSEYKYFIELVHDANDCAMAIKLVDVSGYIQMFQWGCNAGEHTGVAILDAENEQQVLNILPPLLRPKARIVKLNTYTRKEIEEIHLLADKNKEA